MQQRVYKAVHAGCVPFSRAALMWRVQANIGVIVALEIYMCLGNTPQLDMDQPDERDFSFETIPLKSWHDPPRDVHAIKLDLTFVQRRFLDG